jgi:hypothetical protein
MRFELEHFYQYDVAQRLSVISNAIYGEAHGCERILHLGRVEITVRKKLTKPTMRDEHGWPACSTPLAFRGPVVGPISYDILLFLGPSDLNRGEGSPPSAQDAA